MSFNFTSGIKQLDIRRCRLQFIRASFFDNLRVLEFLYLSNNLISEITGHPFPNTLIHLDLSYNDGERLTMPPKIFQNLNNLQTLDLSFTKIDEGSVGTLNSLPPNLTRLSICNTELPRKTDPFIGGSQNIKYNLIFFY